jgi:hypothetical protein
LKYKGETKINEITQGRKWHYKGGQCAMMEEGKSKFEDCECKKKCGCCKNPLKRGQKMEINIGTLPDGFMINIMNKYRYSYTHTMPIWAINWIQVGFDLNIPFC